MKILIFSEVYFPDIIGGGEYSTKMMAEGLARKGHSVVVYCLGKANTTDVINNVTIHRRYLSLISDHFLSYTKSNTKRDSLSAYYKIVNRRKDFFYNRKCYKFYLKTIADETPDLVHSVSGLPYLGRYSLWKAAFDLHIPVSHACRSSVLLEINVLKGVLNPLYRKINSRSSRFLTALVAPSQYMLDCHTNNGIKGTCFNEVIYNAIDFEKVTPTASNYKRKEDVVLYAGNISKEKGLQTLLKAVKELDSVNLMVVGKLRDGFNLERSNKVSVLEWVDKTRLYEIMRAVKIVALPSECKEAFGRILIEGIGNGTIAIGSEIGGIPEVLNHDTKYIFECRNHVELKKIITRIINYSPQEYVSEVINQQSGKAIITEEEYIEKWEMFFRKQIM